MCVSHLDSAESGGRGRELWNSRPPSFPALSPAVSRHVSESDLSRVTPHTTCPLMDTALFSIHFSAWRLEHIPNRAKYFAILICFCDMGEVDELREQIQYLEDRQVMM